MTNKEIKKAPVKKAGASTKAKAPAKKEEQKTQSLPEKLEQSFKANPFNKGVFLAKDHSDWSVGEVHAKARIGKGKYVWVDNPYYEKPAK